MRGDTGKRLNLLAGPQYRIGQHTVTFAQRPKPGELIVVELFEEVDGHKPEVGDPIPPEVARELFGLGA